MTVVDRPSETNFSASESGFSKFAETIYLGKYAWKNEHGEPVEKWSDTAYRVVSNVLGAIGYTPGDKEFKELVRLVTERKFLPGGRYLYSSGRPLHQVNNCLLMRAEDSREGWATLLHNAAMALQTGAGIGIDYSDIRCSGSIIRRTGGFATGPLALMKMINEVGRGIQQGGSRRSAIWAGLNWSHPDCEEFIRMKDWSPDLRSVKEKDYNFPVPMEGTNISVVLDDEFFEAYDEKTHSKHDLARHIYWLTLKRMVKTAEPGFSIDTGENAGETLRNACTEITSRDDSDICNLGSVNLSRIADLDELERCVSLASLFLIAGSVYSDIPYSKVEEIRNKNRRLGLGLMGIHEWLLKRGYSYEPNNELADWLEVYSHSTKHAKKWADRHGLSRPIKTRAIAPNGTIGIIGETTTGIEPIFCVAFKRRYMNGNGWEHQYVIDPTAKRLINHGVDPDTIEDAYSLSYNVEKRIKMQAFVQEYVDHGISSTINLPYPITDRQERQNFGEMLYQYLPKLRGVTAYPDGARGGQPLSTVSYQEAIKHEGTVFEEDESKCVGGLCGV